MLKSIQIKSFGQEYSNLFYTQTQDGSHTIRSFIAEMHKMKRTIQDKDTANKFVGDILEVFAEIFFNAFQFDSAVGITDYTPISIEDDYGVDAIGINTNGHKVAVQVKYRGNPKDLVTYEEIAKTHTAGYETLDLDLDKDKTIYVFTTANGVNYHCTEVLSRKLVVIGRNEIAYKVDNNVTFWKYAYEQIVEVLKNQ